MVEMKNMDQMKWVNMTQEEKELFRMLRRVRGRRERAKRAMIPIEERVFSAEEATRREFSRRF